MSGNWLTPTERTVERRLHSDVVPHSPRTVLSHARPADHGGSYTVEGDSFRAEKPRLWSEGRFTPPIGQARSFDLHPDGERFALAAVPETQTAAKQDKVVFIFNFFDELRRIAPVGK